MLKAKIFLVWGLTLFFGVSSILYSQEATDSVIEGMTFNTDEMSLMLADEPANPIMPGRSALGGVGAILQAIVSLLVVIGLIFVTLHFLRKGSGNAPVASSAVTVLAQQTLKVGASLLVVDVAGKVLVLGVGDDVNLLSEVTDQEMVDQLRLSTPVATTASFASLLSARLTQKGHQPNVRVSSPKDFLGKHTSRLVKPIKPSEDPHHDA